MEETGQSLLNSILAHTHSGLRWVALLLLLYAIINAARSLSSGRYEKKDKMINLFAMVFLHIQLLLGIVLMFVSAKVNFAQGWMKVDLYRFFGMEHLLGMTIAIALVTIGRSKAEKKRKGTRDKHKQILVTYTIALIIILAMIPWPFREALGGRWG